MLRLLLIIVGCFALGYPHLPDAVHLPFIDGLSGSVRVGIGVAAMVFALLLSLRRRGGTAEITDRPIKDELIRRGFHFIAIDRGWQAEGQWNQVPVIVRRVSDYHATRFGRPWVITVTLSGNPVEPWPFLPDQAGIAERTNNGFTVGIVDCTYAGQQDRF